MTVFLETALNEGGVKMAEAVTQALQAVATDIKGVLTGVAPVAIGVAGVFLVWRYGLRFFKSISK